MEKVSGGIETEVNIARIGVVHQALGFLEGLYNRCHMVMEAQLEAAVSSNLAQLVQTVARLIPLFVGGDRLVVTEHRALLCEQAAGQLADIDAACADCLEEIKLLDECLSFSSYGVEHRKLENHWDAILMPRRSSAC